jgi:hypothetical protein
VPQGVQASGALRIGTRVEKINSKHGDSHANGARGTVASSVRPEMWQGRVTQGYFVVWDDYAASVLVMDDRIRELAKK